MSEISRSPETISGPFDEYQFSVIEDYLAQGVILRAFLTSSRSRHIKLQSITETVSYGTYVTSTGPDDTDVEVRELTSPAYEEATLSITLDTKVLADYRQLDATFQEQPKTAAEVHLTFGAASLSIDDCPDGLIYCINQNRVYIGSSPTIGCCWVSLEWCCSPCGFTDWDAYCDQTFGDCQNQCTSQEAETYHC